MSDERYTNDRNWPMARSERRAGGTGLGTMARPGARPRQDRAAQDAPAVQDGPAVQEARRGRQARPGPPSRPAAAEQNQRPAAAQRNQRFAPRQAAAERPNAASPAAVTTAAVTTAAASTVGAPWRVPPARRSAVPRQGVPRGARPEAAQPPQQAQQQAGTQAQAQQPGGLAAAAGPHRMPFVLLLCGLLSGALISALVISTTLAEGSFKISKLQDATSALARQRQALEDQVAQAQSAQVIEERASKLGMRRTGELQFVNLKTGKTTSDGPAWAGAVNAPGYAP